MARYIDADEMIELFREVIGGIAKKPEMTGSLEHMVRASAMVIEMIKDAPAADVVPVRHGRWEPRDDYLRWRCSECGFFIEVDIIDVITVTERSYPNFCPHCGAKMDGGAIGDLMEDDLK